MMSERNSIAAQANHQSIHGKVNIAIGTRHGMLIAIEYAGTDATNHALWLWRCDCGGEKIARVSHAKSYRQCGCKSSQQPFRDITGVRFGMLVASHRLEKGADGVYRWLFVCDCGSEKPNRADNAKKIGHCGCLSRKNQFKDISEQRFGSLVAVRFVDVGNNGLSRWLFQCDCGGQKVMVMRNAREVGHCGCRRAKRMAVAKTAHGKTSRGGTYGSWASMKTRCLNPNSQFYSLYGGRGISICDAWLSFANFYLDMGDCPIGMSLDRINNDGNYEPGNCRWATRTEQQRNKSTNVNISHGGKTQCVAQWAIETGLSDKLIYDRIRHGWTGEDAITIPVKAGSPYRNRRQ